MSKQQIRDLALAKGFKLKQQTDGEWDLNPYVYDFANALIDQYTKDQSAWVSVDDRLPITRNNGRHQQGTVMATDGVDVCEIEFHSGSFPVEWYEWSEYGDIKPEHITHWQPKPLPPTQEA